jgi:hypothetical protein
MRKKSEGTPPPVDRTVLEASNSIEKTESQPTASPRSDEETAAHKDRFVATCAMELLLRPTERLLSIGSTVAIAVARARAPESEHRQISVAELIEGSSFALETSSWKPTVLFVECLAFKLGEIAASGLSTATEHYLARCRRLADGVVRLCTTDALVAVATVGLPACEEWSSQPDLESRVLATFRDAGLMGSPLHRRDLFYPHTLEPYDDGSGVRMIPTRHCVHVVQYRPRRDVAAAE